MFKLFSVAYKKYNCYHHYNNNLLTHFNITSSLHMTNLDFVLLMLVSH